MQPESASRSRVPPLLADGVVASKLYLSGVSLEEKVLAQFVLWVCYFHGLLDMVQTDQCVFFSDSL